MPLKYKVRAIYRLHNKYEYYYITPDDYTLRSYEGERPMTGGSIGKITVMWGNDAYTLIRITWENPNSLFAELSQVTKTYKLTVGGGAVEELNGNVHIYEGNVYYKAPEALYRWDYQGNATKLMDRPGTLYFQNGYVFSRDGYNIVGIKL